MIIPLLNSANLPLAKKMITVHDDEPYGVITVNLGYPLQTDRLAFVDFSFDPHDVLTNFVPFTYN